MNKGEDLNYYSLRRIQARAFTALILRLADDISTTNTEDEELIFNPFGVIGD